MNSFGFRKIPDDAGEPQAVHIRCRGPGKEIGVLLRREEPLYSLHVVVKSLAIELKRDQPIPDEIMVKVAIKDRDTDSRLEITGPYDLISFLGNRQLLADIQVEADKWHDLA